MFQIRHIPLVVLFLGMQLWIPVFSLNFTLPNPIEDQNLDPLFSNKIICIIFKVQDSWAAQDFMYRISSRENTNQLVIGDPDIVIQGDEVMSPFDWLVLIATNTSNVRKSFSNYMVIN